MLSQPDEVRLEPDRFYSRADVARILDVDPRTIAEMIASGKLPAVKAGARDRVLGKVLLDLATAGVAR